MAYCFKCGIQLAEGSNFCQSCGTEQDAKSQANQPNSQFNKMAVANTKGKSKTTLLVLAVVLPLLGFCGIGHMYAGRFGRGIASLIIGWILYALYFMYGQVGVLVFAFYAYHIYDANKIANQLGLS